MQNQEGRRPLKRLLFDRRYGWVVDEWRDPSEEALAGGRGMFCMLPIAKALIDYVANSVVQALEKQHQIFPAKPNPNPEITREPSRVDYMNEHLQKVTLFDLAIQQNLVTSQAAKSLGEAPTTV